MKNEVYKTINNGWAYSYEGQSEDGFPNKEFAYRAYNKKVKEDPDNQYSLPPQPKE